MDSKEKKKHRNSKWFKDLRKELIDDADGRCYISGVKKVGKAKRYLQAHHLNPKTYGKETKDDLVILSALQHKVIENLLRQSKKKNSDFNIDVYCEKLKEIYYLSGGK